MAAFLDIPHVAWARKLIFGQPDLLQVERLLDHGYDLVKVHLPALITVVKEINDPRLPSFKAKLRAKSAVIPVLTMQDLGLKEHQVGFKGSYTRVVKVFPPPARGQREILQGSAEDMATTLWSRLQQLQGR
jgi:electron transfer flavoprotein beta subunit